MWAGSRAGLEILKIHTQKNHDSKNMHTRPLMNGTGISQETVESIVRTCKACCRAGIPYNNKDMVLAGCFSSTLYDPSPDHQDVFGADSLYCAQSVVLILRTCLPPDHPWSRSLASINSRSVTLNSGWETCKKRDVCFCACIG
jgi:hypothetical protein